jgi:hypothetical protein
MADELPLLPQSLEEKKSSPNYIRYGVGALLISGALIGASFYNNSTHPEVSSELDYKVSASEVLLYKRTHPSRDAATDCKFLTETIGMECSYYATNAKADGDGACAHRAQGQAGAISYHNIKDQFEPKGMAEAWIETFNTHHEYSFDIDNGNQQWNQFMTLNTGLFTMSLDTHIRKWKKNGVKFKAHKYVNPADSEVMYVLITYNPSTGNVIEIHGSSSDLYDSEYTELPDNVCLEAIAPGHPKAQLEESFINSVNLYDELMAKEAGLDMSSEDSESDSSSSESSESEDDDEGDDDDDFYSHGAQASAGLFAGIHGYPYAMFIKVSHPSNNVEKAVEWMSNNAQLEMSIHQDTKTSTCKVAKVMVSKAQDVGKASLMFVEVDGLKDLHAKEYIEYVENVHKERMGVQRGWDRFIDSHIGLFYRDIILDDIAPTLVSNDASFMAFRAVGDGDAFCKDSVNIDECGSIWTTGTSGLSIEMHGFFGTESKFFKDHFSLVYMDMCNSETNYGSPEI